MKKSFLPVLIGLGMTIFTAQAHALETLLLCSGEHLEVVINVQDDTVTADYMGKKFSAHGRSQTVDNSMAIQAYDSEDSVIEIHVDLSTLTGEADGIIGYEIIQKNSIVCKFK